MALLDVRNLKKVYTTRFGGSQVQALSNVSFSVEEGEYVAIMGESGSGKTTLLNILASLDKPTSGEVLLEGKNLVAIREKEIAAFRRDHLGFVFQDFNLLDTFSLQDNIFLPLVLQGKGYKEMAARLAPLAKKLEIADILQKYPYEVSGGRNSGPAAARALITAPRLVLADEPTAPSIPAPPTTSCAFSPPSTRKGRPSSWSLTAPAPPATPGGCSSSRTARCSIRSTAGTPPTRSCTRRSRIPLR